MDRVTIGAVVVALSSVLVSLLLYADGKASLSHTIALLIPLAFVAFPQMLEILDAGFRCTYGGMAHGGEGPTPAVVMRVVAGILLVVFIAVHHYSMALGQVLAQS